MPQILPVVSGSQGFDTDTILSSTTLPTFIESGYKWCVRYLSRISPENRGDLSSNEVLDIMSAGLGLMAVQHCPLSGWQPTSILGNLYGLAAVSNANNAGLLVGTTIWCDLEEVSTYSTQEDVIAYVNSWASIVAKANYIPGLYVGANQPLTSDELYWRLIVKKYWKSASNVPDIPVRGYCMMQSLTNLSPVATVPIDRDVAMFDSIGDSATMMAP